jgi:uncharacterized protein
MSAIARTPGGVILTVRVVPRSSRNRADGLLGEAIKIRLQAPPVEGRANEALVAFLAAALGVPRRNIVLLAGAASRNKRVRVTGTSEADARAALGL